MAKAKRRDVEWAAVPADSLQKSAISSDRDRRTGGPVAAMQADLVRRLVADASVGEVTTAAERLVRRLSVAGGHLALFAGYAGAAMLILR